MRLNYDVLRNWLIHNAPSSQHQTDIWQRQVLAWLKDGKKVTLTDGRVLKANERRTQFYCHRKGAAMTDEEKRSCYDCKHQGLCYLRRQIENAIVPSAEWMIEGAPCKWTDIFGTLAWICNQYTKMKGAEK